MTLELQNIMLEEYQVLKKLYKSLQDQNQYLVKRDVFSLDGIVKVIEERSKALANCEIKRRKITEGRSMKELVAEIGSEEMKKSYEDIVELIEKVQLQKDTNDALVKQWLNFTNQMLRALNPAGGAVTYNALGRSR